MTRSDSDSWDLASSVGATATMVAAARALASREPEPLINDPFADPLVRAVGVEFFARLLDGEIEVPGADDDPQFNLQRLTQVMAVRTRFFDEFFTDAGAAGIQQAVILAAGLDSRAYRLVWSDGTVVYEIDQPEVVEFKTSTLAKLGARPTAERRTVPIDLRDDWPAALRRSGFDESKPTAWSAEGLLLYLPPEAQDRLFDTVTALSAPGSRLATEYHPDGPPMLDERAKAMNEHWGKHGFDVDLSSLVYRGERNPVTDYLTEHGWRVSTRSRADLFADAGLELPATPMPTQNTLAVTAVR
ncbi:SAM-dependent methyltransferase [Mycobacterium kyorinense]|uniref:S-adenosyl-L-methionine-dependent methyltransferase n=1 Tax=Mycobacterium kyorinense TaxID=487514 RepID=A0A1A2Z1A0_9MYCO|nr:class I SAM-dependent methyltransferase [Mycobacterium kyorinense]OBI42946.1 SAM-dependent methyltransferase [Mycobacterium kyorinense]